MNKKPLGFLLGDAIGKLGEEWMLTNLTAGFQNPREIIISFNEPDSGRKIEDLFEQENKVRFFSLEVTNSTDPTKIRIIELRNT
ncbi:MAG: hypothetical protein KW804_03180 [Candidatus Doudnabacteria bacterium]|nr:hypothetical protein [Candidatus Doudnabacteria bacterium]